MSINGNTMAGVEQVLRLLDNPAAMQKALTELREGYERFREMAALAGPATEIVALREQIGKDKEAFDKATSEFERCKGDRMREALQESDRIVVDAQNKASATRAAADETMSKVLSVKAELDANVKQLKEDRLKLDRERDVLNAYRQTLDNREKALEEAEAEVENERKRLAAVAAKFQADVAA